MYMCVRQLQPLIRNFFHEKLKGSKFVANIVKSEICGCIEILVIDQNVKDNLS